MRTLNTSFVLGYHGCDRGVAERLLAGADFRKSDNDYDWLGPGVYFWEANPRRGLDYARELQRLRRPPVIGRPAVVGAVIDLGNCLDLTTSSGITQVKRAHASLIDTVAAGKLGMPRNTPDLLRRNLDCAVIRLLHHIRGENEEAPLDTVRGVFVEGSPVYDGSGIHGKTHIQLCVCNPDCIKGVFRVPSRFLT